MSIRILITSGDPAGIGPEIILAALKSLAKGEDPIETEIAGLLSSGSTVLSITGSRMVYDLLIRKFDLPFTWSEKGSSLKLCYHAKPGLIFDFLDVPHSAVDSFAFGSVDAENGRNALGCLEKAVNYLRLKQIDAVVTAPVSKEAIALTMPGFIGHTEYFADAFGISDFSMCFISPVFNLVLLTTHVALSKLGKYMTAERIDLGIRHAARLKQVLRDETPLLFLGFNPHAGENGLFGREDILIGERVKSAAADGVDVRGPLAADSAFIDVVGGKYGTVIASYHDQGLIPLKMLSKGKSVNITLGLPFIRTSVDHGTAFDIAGTMQADHRSLLYALREAFRFNKEC